MQIIVCIYVSAHIKTYLCIIVICIFLIPVLKSQCGNPRLLHMHKQKSQHLLVMNTHLLVCNKFACSIFQCISVICVCACHLIYSQPTESQVPSLWTTQFMINEHILKVFNFIKVLFTEQTDQHNSLGSCFYGTVIYTNKTENFS